MSALKQAFEGILLRHLTDHHGELKILIKINDLRNIVVEYLINEEAFETELTLLAYYSESQQRLTRLLVNSKNEYVKRWLSFLRNLLPRYWDFEEGIKQTLGWSVFTPCNRIWCWYHRKQLNNAGDCICRRPLNRRFSQTREAREIFALFTGVPSQINRHYGQLLIGLDEVAEMDEVAEKDLKQA